MSRRILRDWLPSKKFNTHGHQLDLAGIAAACLLEQVAAAFEIFCESKLRSFLIANNQYGIHLLGNQRRHVGKGLING